MRNDYGITKDHLIASYIAYDLSQGQVRTSNFKNLRLKDGNFELRPEARYYIYTQEGHGILKLTWSW